MNSEPLFLFLSLLTVLSFVLSLIFVVGIVWRVELELDLSFKFFAIAVAALLATELVNLLPLSRWESWWQWVLPGVKLIAAINLLLGLFFMRDLVRRMNGEKSAQ